MRVLYLPKFARQYKKLPQEVKDVAKKRERIFRGDPFDSRLKTHKLTGALSDFHAFSVTHSYRIIFQFASKDEVWFYEIGTHNIYS